LKEENSVSEWPGARDYHEEPLSHCPRRGCARHRQRAGDYKQRLQEQPTCVVRSYVHAPPHKNWLTPAINPVPPSAEWHAVIDFDQIAAAAAGLELCCRGLTEVSPYASSVAWLLFLYDYDAHRRRGGADRLLQHLNVKTRESPSPSACNRSDSYGGDTTSIIARRERSIASKIRGERSVASKRCLSGRCHGKSGH